MIEGTHRACRDNVQTVTPTERPAKPDDVSSDNVASDHWDLIVRTRGDWLDASDAAALQTVCETWSLQRRMKKLFEENLADFRLRASYNALTELWAKQAAKFGLDPRSREALGLIEPIDPTRHGLAAKYLS